MTLLGDLKEILEIADENGAEFPRTAIQDLLNVHFSKAHYSTEKKEIEKIRQNLEEIMKVLETGSITFCREALKPTGKVYLDCSRILGEESEEN
ncbi:hypothetical protein KAI54_02280 [Candidatus Gracilibacteria bacterium]|nr:hypothetical protein [Candidatus Gracilibacteria bacterium]